MTTKKRSPATKSAINANELALILQATVSQLAELKLLTLSKTVDGSKIRINLPTALWREDLSLKDGKK